MALGTVGVLFHGRDSGQQYLPRERRRPTQQVVPLAVVRASDALLEELSNHAERNVALELVATSRQQRWDSPSNLLTYLGE